MSRRPGPSGPLPQSGDANVGTAEIADGAVTTAKVAARAITPAKLDGGAGTDGQVLTVQADGSVAPESATIGIRKAAAADDVFSSGVTGDAHDRFVIDADGTLRWGSGSGTSDLSLSRNSSGVYVVTGNAKVTGNLAVGRDFVGVGMGVFEGTISNIGNADGIVVTTKTVASTNGFWDIYGISSQNTDQRIDSGIADTGRRVGITGDAYNASTLFAGSLATQWGVRGRAGFAAAAGSGARTVTDAAGGYFEIRNEAAGTTITNAYGVFINNSDVSGGAITNRYDLYASSENARSYFAGKVGIGLAATNPLVSLHIIPGSDNAADLEAVRLQNNGENGVHLSFRNAFGPLARITGTKLGGGASADEGVVSISTAINSTLFERLRISNSGFDVFHTDGASGVVFAITPAGLPKWSAAGNAQTTVGAAGGASALPATPTKYLKVVDSAGTTLVVPAYAAS